MPQRPSTFSYMNNKDTKNSIHNTASYLNFALLGAGLFKVNLFSIVVVVILLVLRVSDIAVDVAQEVLNRLRENFICNHDADLYVPSSH